VAGVAEEEEAAEAAADSEIYGEPVGTKAILPDLNLTAGKKLRGED
tara:strand:- start:203 stop:340 length:138 start_codon:yes stop_codon:yes gene_type:complete